VKSLLALLTFVVAVPLGLLAIFGVIAYVLSVLIFTLAALIPILALFAIAGALVMLAIELLD
jgi:hypothetical protein